MAMLRTCNAKNGVCNDARTSKFRMVMRKLPLCNDVTNVTVRALCLRGGKISPYMVLSIGKKKDSPIERYIVTSLHRYKLYFSAWLCGFWCNDGVTNALHAASGISPIAPIAPLQLEGT